MKPRNFPGFSGYILPDRWQKPHLFSRLTDYYPFNYIPKGLDVYSLASLFLIRLNEIGVIPR